MFTLWRFWKSSSAPKAIWSAIIWNIWTLFHRYQSLTKKKWLSQKSFSHSLRMSLVLKYRLKLRPLGGGLAPWVEWDTNMPQGHHRSFPACFSPYSIFPSFPICLTEKQNFHRLKLNLTQVQLCQCNNDICCRTDARIKKYKIKINLPSEYNAKILPHPYTAVKLIWNQHFMKLLRVRNAEKVLTFISCSLTVKLLNF